MKNKLVFGVLAVSIFMFTSDCTAYRKDIVGSAMLMDLNPTTTVKDRPESDQPIPLPLEPLPGATVGEPKQSALLDDLEVLEPQEVELGKPIPLPSEPKPLQSEK